MFEKFTEGAIKVIMLSQEEARRMGHNFVGTEQLLLGLIGQRHGIGAKALKKMKVSLRKARKEIELYIGRGTGFVASEIPFTPRAKRVLEMSVFEGKDLGQNFVGTEHILLALLAETDGVAMRTLDKMRVDIQKLRNLVYRYIEDSQEDILKPLTQAEKFIIERDRKGSPTPTLDEYSDNVTRDAITGKLDPVIGREKEINDLITVLARRTKNNPVLVGEPGVGKTAVVEGLAQLILAEKVPDFLDGNILLSLDLGSILAGTKYRGEFEERLKRIVEEASNDSSVIVVIDEIHTLVGAGAAEGAVDAANILKPALARGGFRCIGATTTEEYKKYIERDAALERRFQPVKVDEPSVEITVKILEGLKPKFEQHHALIYTYEALEQAAVLSSKYVPDRFLPDKAIDVLDEAGARVRLENKSLPRGLQLLMSELHKIVEEKDRNMKQHAFDLAKTAFMRELEVRTHLRIMKQSLLANELRGFSRSDVDKVLGNDVAKVISNWTMIPVDKMTEDESDRLLKMEEIIHERIIGQEQAVEAVSKAVRRARVGIRDSKRPIASFIFAGPTGVGKTELTKAVSDFIFGDEESMIRLDMSEYMEKHTVAKLIGSPPGYVGFNEGGQLTEAVRTKPYSVVLFDEVEKAHPDVFNIMLQILDDGRLTDSKGKVIDFSNTLIVMTTNIGAKIIERESGIKPRTEEDQLFKLTLFSKESQSWEPAKEAAKNKELVSKLKRLVNDELKNFFRPEFLNRIDEIIVFSHLTKMDLWQICDIMIAQLVNRLKEKDVTIIVEQAVRALLTDEGYDPIYGARPLRRAIMGILEDRIAESFLVNKIHPGTIIRVERKTLKQKKQEIKSSSVPIENQDEILESIEKFYGRNHGLDTDYNNFKLYNPGVKRRRTNSPDLTNPLFGEDEYGLDQYNVSEEPVLMYEDVRDNETYTNELSIIIDTSNVSEEILNGKIEEKEEEFTFEYELKRPELSSAVTMSGSEIQKLVKEQEKQKKEEDDQKEKNNF